MNDMTKTMDGMKMMVQGTETSPGIGKKLEDLQAAVGAAVGIEATAANMVTWDYMGQRFNQQQAEEDAKLQSLKTDLEDRLSQTEALTLVVQTLADSLQKSMGPKGQGNERMPTPLTERRSFGPLESWTGIREQFPDWHFRATGLFEEEPLFEGYLKFLEDGTDDKLTEEKMDDFRIDAGLSEEQAKWLDQNLWQVLRRKLAGTPLDILKSSKKKFGIRGGLTWRALIKDAKGQTGHRQGGLATRVFSPDRATSWESLEAALTAWRNHKAEYEADGEKFG